MTESYHDTMRRKLYTLFPYFNDKQIDYAINKISNKIRNCKLDVYQVWIDKEKTFNAQYADRSSFKVDTTEIHIEIQID